MFRYLSPALVSSLLWALLVVCSPLAGAAANLAAGDGHTLALASDGTVWVWGDNCRGQLGDGTTTNRATPVQVLGAEGNGFLNLLQVSTPSSGDIVMTLEEPVAGSTYSGVTNVRGWAVASAGMDKVELYVDDQFFSPIPLGGRRADVGAAYPDYPGSAQSGFAMAFNYSELAAGPHTFTVRATDVSGGARDARVTANVVRFENSYMADPAAVNLDQATLGGSGNALTIQNLLVDGQPYTVRLDWRPAAQSFAFTQINSATRASAASDGSEVHPEGQIYSTSVPVTGVFAGRDDGARTLQPLAAADNIVMTLEEPVAGSTYSGVTNVRGWAVASAGMDKVELYVDDQFFSPIPLGGRRADVGAAYPDYPGSAQSGFAMAFNYSELAAGPHTFTVRATDVSGGARDARVTANVVRFENSYMADPAAVNLDQATLGGSGNALTIQNLLVDGQPYTVRLDWRPAAQSFAFTQIARADRPNQSPAGGLWRGEAVCFYMAANGSSLTREGSTCPPGAASDPSPAFYGGPWPIGDGLSVEVFYYEDVPVVDNAFSFVEAYAGSVTGTFTSPQAASGTAVAGSITWSAIPASRSAAVLGSRPISGVARRDSANGTAASVIRDAAGRIVVRLTYSP